jgi:hypothetical protein
MAAIWPHLPLHIDQEIRMRQEALMVDNCRHYVIAATGAPGCRALINVKLTMTG